MANEETMVKPKESDGWGYLVALGVVLGALVVIPVLLAAGAFLLLRARVRRSEALIAAGVGALGLALNPAERFGGYFSWLLNLVTGSEPRFSGMPWLTLLLVTLVLTGIAVAAQNTRATAWIPTSIGRFRRTPLNEESILPTHKEKQRASIASPPKAALAVSAAAHSIVAPTAAGKRSFPIGVDKRRVPVMITEDEIRMHGLIFGSTGSGKSETIKSIAGGLLDLGWDGMILDLKEDTGPGGLRDWCDTYAQHHSIPYQEIKLSDPNPRFWFNALAGMGLDEARDTILSMQKFDNGFYEALNKQQLGELLTLMYAATEVDPIKFQPPNLGSIGKLLGHASLATAVKPMMATVITATEYTKEDFQSLSGTDKNFVETARALGSRIASEYASQAGRVLLSPPPPGVNRPAIDVTQGGITYVGLDSTGKVALARVISTAVLKRMSVYASDRISGKVQSVPGQKPKPRFLIVDEANFIDRMTTMALLSRARSSGIAMILCTQGPMDWRGSHDEPGVEALVQNTNVTIIMSQGDRESAEVCADIIGRSERTTLSHQMRDGEIDEESGSLRTTVEHRVSPDELRSLEIGQAVVRVGKPTERVTWAKVAMRDPKTMAQRH